MKTPILYSIILTSLLSACSFSSTKEKINKAGDVAGQTAGEFISGVAHGVGKAFDAKIDLSQNLIDKGLNFGKSTVSNDSTGTDNLLTIYIIFNTDFSGDITAKAFDSHALEMGRVIRNVSGKKNDAKYFEFHFDKRTTINSDSKLVVE